MTTSDGRRHGVLDRSNKREPSLVEFMGFPIIRIPLRRQAMQKTWILTADGSRARIFEALGSDSKFREVDDFANPQGRLNNRELRTDASGRYSGKGQGHHGHTTLPQVD